MVRSRALSRHVYVMRPHTLTQLQNRDGEVTCKVCGKPIKEGELILRRRSGRRGYVHLKCDEERRI